MGFNNGYDSGYDDAKAELAPKIKALEARIAQLEASSGGTQPPGAICASPAWIINSGVPVTISGAGLAGFDPQTDTVTIVRSSDEGYYHEVDRESLQFDSDRNVLEILLGDEEAGATGDDLGQDFGLDGFEDVTVRVTIGGATLTSQPISTVVNKPD